MALSISAILACHTNIASLQAKSWVAKGMIAKRLDQACGAIGLGHKPAQHSLKLPERANPEAIRISCSATNQFLAAGVAAVTRRR